MESHTNRPGYFFTGAAVFVLGLLIGIFLHYTFHILMLPSEPFIYVIF